MRIGFAGLGRMGVRMANNLAEAGNEVIVWNRTREKCETFARDHDASIANSPMELAERSELVFSMLADDQAVDEIYLGDAGFLRAAGGASVFVEMGTISVPQILKVHKALEHVGHRFVDAPVSGSTKAAGEAQLLIMAGARADYAPELPPLLDKLGKKTVWLESAGAGATMKLAVNMLVHGLNQTLSEALTLTSAAGIDPETAYEVVENSAAAAPVMSYRKGLYLDEAAHNVSFTVALARKDVGLAIDLAKSLNILMPQAELNHSILHAAGEAGYDTRDMASIRSFVEKGLK